VSFCRNPASQKALRASSTRRFLLLVLRQKSYGKIRKLFLNSSLAKNFLKNRTISVVATRPK